MFLESFISVRITGESGLERICNGISVSLFSKFVANSSSIEIATGLMDGKIIECGIYACSNNRELLLIFILFNRISSCVSILFRLIFKSNRSSFDIVEFSVEVEFWARTSHTDENEIFAINNSRIKGANSFTTFFYLAYKR